MTNSMGKLELDIPDFKDTLTISITFQKDGAKAVTTTVQGPVPPESGTAWKQGGDVGGDMMNITF